MTRPGLRPKPFDQDDELPEEFRQPWFCRLVTLSTAHLPSDLLKEVEEMLRTEDRFDLLGGASFHPAYFGGFLAVPKDPVWESENEEPVHPVILAIQVYARKHGCTWVLLDNWGPVVPDLDVFTDDSVPRLLHLHCDGNHCAPACADPQCWQREP